MGSIRFVFFGVIVSLILAAVLIPSTASAGGADGQEQLSRGCSFCHAAPHSPGALENIIGQAGLESPGAKEIIAQENIAQKIKFYSRTPRYGIHAGLEAAALLLDLPAALFMLIVAGWGFLDVVKRLITRVQPEDQISPFFSPLFLRGLNLLIAGEIIGSISTTINPTWTRIAVLVSVVIIRVLIGSALLMHQIATPTDPHKQLSTRLFWFP